MNIKVIYLARLSEDLGKKEEYIELTENQSSIRDIFLKLKLDKFDYQIYSAKNYEHASLDSIVVEKDEIAFFPTITGG
jgi:molybdopterin converting factor small subunit